MERALLTVLGAMAIGSVALAGAAPPGEATGVEERRGRPPEAIVDLAPVVTQGLQAPI
jgi:hypothetical protein